jgi:hypothetical protein
MDWEEEKWIWERWWELEVEHEALRLNVLEGIVGIWVKGVARRVCAPSMPLIWALVGEYQGGLVLSFLKTSILNLET